MREKSLPGIRFEPMLSVIQAFVFANHHILVLIVEMLKKDHLLVKAEYFITGIKSVDVIECQK